MTAGSAVSLAHNPSVAHVSINHPLYATGTLQPAYDYMPQTIQPLAASAGTPNPSNGKNIGVAVIDSGIQINQDLIGNGFPQVSMPKASFRGKASMIITAMGPISPASSPATA
jgi:hypothetical protein